MTGEGNGHGEAREWHAGQTGYFRPKTIRQQIKHKLSLEFLFFIYYYLHF